MHFKICVVILKSLRQNGKLFGNASKCERHMQKHVTEILDKSIAHHIIVVIIFLFHFNCLICNHSYCISVYFKLL